MLPNTKSAARAITHSTVGGHDKETALVKHVTGATRAQDDN